MLDCLHKMQAFLCGVFYVEFTGAVLITNQKLMTTLFIRIDYEMLNR